MEQWRTELERGANDAAWDAFIAQYRRLLFATIRHYVREHDDVMDVFAHVCGALRERDLRRLRQWSPDAERKARFSTWLVTVVQRLTIDWLRSHRERRRAPAVPNLASGLQREIVDLVFTARRSHLEAYGIICARQPPGPSYSAFLSELREAYAALASSGISIHAVFAAGENGTPSSVQADDGFERRDWLKKALAQLSTVDRVAVELFIVDNLPAADVARIVGLPSAKSVYNRVYRGLDTIREWLAASGIGRNDL